MTGPGRPATLSGDIAPAGLPPASRVGPQMGTPVVILLDARDRGWTEQRLRFETRALTSALAQGRAEAPAGAGFCSRSYRYPLSLAAVHDRPVGVDIERVDDLATDLGPVICTAGEKNILATVSDGRSFLAGLWSGKEALAKALGDPVAYAPDRLESPMTWPQTVQDRRGASDIAATHTCGRWRACILKLPAGYVGWLCWAM